LRKEKEPQAHGEATTKTANVSHSEASSWTFENPPDEYELVDDTEAVDNLFCNRMLKEFEIIKTKALQMSGNSIEDGWSDSFVPTRES